tara:strand:+ start:2604 stop:3842 length:1239 start_codon:yes stop_codon:yes gene_type:complete
MVDIAPTIPQFEYITSRAKYPALVAGFGAGKTEAAIKRSIIGKLMNPECDRGFYAPTYDLLRMIAFPRFEAALEEMGIPYRLYKSPLNYLELHGKGRIYFRSMDAPERIIGYEHADADVDELDTMKVDNAAHAWRQIVARNRQVKADGSPNSIGVTTTPEGFKFVYQTWKKDPKAGYEIIQAPTRSNPYLPRDYIQSLKDIYPSNLLAAYLEGQFVNLQSGTVYSAYDRIACRSSEVVKDGELLNIGMDFNVTNMSAVVYVSRGIVWHAVDELKGIYDTPNMIRVIQERYPGHSIRIYPDASGRSRKSVDASVSDISLLESAGFVIYANRSNPMVKDRIMATNVAFEKGRVKINDQSCPEYARCMEQLAYDANGSPDKKSNIDHLPDAGTYPIAYEMPVLKPVADLHIRFVS